MNDPFQNLSTSTVDPVVYPTYASIFDDHRDLEREIRKYEPSSLIASIAGLLTMPEFQANTVRLEVLQHLAVSKAHGKIKPQPKKITSWLNTLGEGRAGSMEDSVEDVFVSRVFNKDRNFLVFEGLYENSGFYLQIFLSLLDKMPNKEPFMRLRQSAHALLLLSDETVKRSRISSFTIGNIDTAKAVDPNLVRKSEKTKKYILFSKTDLDRLGIKRQDIKTFILDKSAQEKLSSEHYGHSSLERYPLLSMKGNILIALPAAVSMAIRRMVIEFCLSNGYENSLYRAYVAEFETIFKNTPSPNNSLISRQHFRKKGELLVTDVVIHADEGRFLHIYFIFDNFAHYDQTGAIGSNPDLIVFGENIANEINQKYKTLSSKHPFRSGLSLVVQCSWGRPMPPLFNIPDNEKWRDEIISAPDLITMIQISEFSPLHIWSLLDSLDCLAAINIEIFNINGLLNLYAWSDALNGHLIPHDDLLDDAADKSLMFQINPNSLLYIRQKVALENDIHRAMTWDNRSVIVRRHNKHLFFKEDENVSLYESIEDLEQDKFMGVYETEMRDWWITTDMPYLDNQGFHYRLWCALMMWLARSANLIEDKINSLPAGPIAWICLFEDIEDPRTIPTLSRDQTKALIDVNVDDNVIRVTARAGFLSSFRLVENVGESLLVEEFLSGVCQLSEDTQLPDTISSLMKQIVPDKWARDLHIFPPQSIRDHVAHKASTNPIKSTKIDDALSRIGLGWRIRAREEGSNIEGIKPCCDYLNCLVHDVWEKIRLELKQYNRETILAKLLHNYESLAIETNRWLRTARATLSIHNDKKSILNESSIEISRLNAALLGSHILMEMALCECPKDSGITPGRLDISRLFSDIMLMYQFGGWSDAIRYECKIPEIRITPYGNLKTDTNFDEFITNPYGQNLSIYRYQDGAGTYELNYRKLKPTDTVCEKWGFEFWEAWIEAFEFTIDDVRFFMDNLEYEGIKRQELVFSISEPDLYSLSASRKIGENIVKNILNAFSLSSRPKWDCPPNSFSANDLYPWRFRRRLSVVSRPIIRIDDSPPRYLVAPGLIRAGVKKIIEYCYTGGYEAGNFSSEKMRNWIGTAEDKRGHDFNEKVADQLDILGWKVDREANLTKILNKKLDKNYGDIDVFAWKENRVLIIECKDLELAMTISDIARQLKEFQGEDNSKGNSDRMKKHLLRIEKLRKHQSEIIKFTKGQESPLIEGLLVFSRVVPMQFTNLAEKHGVRILTIDDLSSL